MTAHGKKAARRRRPGPIRYRARRERCATCHHGSAESRAPSLDALRARPPQAVLEALVTGSRRPQGARLSGPERRRAVAEFVTGKALAGDVRGAEGGRCAASVAVPDGPAWNGRRAAVGALGRRRLVGAN